MATFKKKDFKSKYLEGEPLDELVDDDGGLIGSDTKQYNSDSQVSTDTPFHGDEEAEQGIPQTTADFMAKTKQKRQWPYYGSNYSSGKKAAIPEAEQKILAKERMEGLIEDLLSQRSDTHDVVNNTRVQDINRNDVPDISDITANNQALANSIQSVVNMMNTQGVEGEDAGIILNYIISNMDVSSIPSDFRRIIKSKV
jgi:hypothetical protein